MTSLQSQNYRETKEISGCWKLEMLRGACLKGGVLRVIGLFHILIMVVMGVTGLYIFAKTCRNAALQRANGEKNLRRGILEKQQDGGPSLESLREHEGQWN